MSSADITEQGYHRVHRATPLLKFWSGIVAFVLAIVMHYDKVVAMLWDFLTTGHGKIALVSAVVAALGFAVACVGIWFVSGVWWRRMGYRVGDQELSFRHGVLSSHVRTARFERTQAVDVVEPFIARLFGLAAVRVETAGGVDSVIVINYLRMSDAEALRDVVLQRVRGADVVGGGEDEPASGSESGLETEPDADLGADALISEIPLNRSVGGVLLHPWVIVLVIGGGLALLSPLGWAAALPLVLGTVPSVFRFLNEAWRFTAHVNEDPASGDRQLVVSYGLTERRRQTIRVDRIHAVAVQRPMLWRFAGWYRVEVSVAGYGSVLSDNSGSTRVLPVGTRDEALALVQLATGLNAEEVEVFADPDGHTNPTYTTPRAAFWATPIDRAQQAVTLVEPTAEHAECAVVHKGRWARRMPVVATPHIQELTYTRGPLNRMMGVSDLRFNLVPGPVSMNAQQLRAADATELLHHLRGRQLPRVQERCSH